MAVILPLQVGTPCIHNRLCQHCLGYHLHQLPLSQWFWVSILLIIWFWFVSSNKCTDALGYYVTTNLSLTVWHMEFCHSQVTQSHGQAVTLAQPMAWSWAMHITILDIKKIKRCGSLQGLWCSSSNCFLSGFRNLQTYRSDHQTVVPTWPQLVPTLPPSQRCCQWMAWEIRRIKVKEESLKCYSFIHSKWLRWSTVNVHKQFPQPV